MECGDMVMLEMMMMKCNHIKLFYLDFEIQFSSDRSSFLLSYPRRILHVIFRGIFKPTTLVLGLSLFLTFKHVCLTMDFSSPTRALQSLQRRRPSVSEETLQSLRQLLTNDTSSGDYLEGVSTLLHKESARWECLAVGLLLATQICSPHRFCADSVHIL